MLKQLECAIAHQLARLDEISAVLFEAGLVDRQCSLVRQQLDEERGRAFERDFQRLGINGLYAEFFNLGLAFVDRFGIFDRIKDIGVAGRCLRVFDTAHRENKIFRRYRRAIGPVGIVAQLERVDGAVIGNFPAFRGTRNNLAVRVIDRQAFVEVLDDECLDIDGGLRLVKGLRFTAVAAMQHGFCQCRACAYHQRSIPIWNADCSIISRSR